MQEFSSVSVSSYEAGSLTDRLTEQSSEGWSVVAIVPTGSTITAYLARQKSGAPGEQASTGASVESDDTASAASTAAAGSKPSSSDPAAGVSDSDADADGAEGEQAEGDTSGDVSATVAGSAEPVLPHAASAAADPPKPAAVDPVDEPAGWAVQPEPANAPAKTPDIAAMVASGTSAATTPAASTTATSAATSATSTGAGSTGEAAAGVAPAGWYADPSSRFELRYWDGTQWTEHVSRAGQQYTDPPVA